MSDIFISYSHEDTPTVRTLAEALGTRGWSVWWDTHIRPGREFDRAIENALDSAHCVIVMWSKDSVDSDWVRAEASEGLRRRVLLPVMIDEDVDPPLRFRQVQTLKLLNWDGSEVTAEFQELSGAVERFIRRGMEAQQAEQPTPPAPVEPVVPVPEPHIPTVTAPSRPTLKFAGLAGLVLVVAAAIIFAVIRPDQSVSLNGNSRPSAPQLHEIPEDVQQEIQFQLENAEDLIRDSELDFDPYRLSEGPSSANESLKLVLKMNQGNEFALDLREKIIEQYVEHVRSLIDRGRFQQALDTVRYGLNVNSRERRLIQLEREICKQIPHSCQA